MDVGVNYPWFDYGWDFGDSPPGWRSGRTPRWRRDIDADLRKFMRIGIGVVRWFILGDGLTYGTGSDAPQRDTNSARAAEWRFTPPALSRRFQTHFGLLLDRFLAVNRRAKRPIRLMPVLVDFHFCDAGRAPVTTTDPTTRRSVPDPAWIKGGRADAINDATKRGQFLRSVLQPLLHVAATPARRRVIYAWDIVNEPEWVTTGWHPDRRRRHPVDEAAMRAFITESKTMIRAASFKSTIGFNRLDTIRRTRIYAEYNQFHHYSPASRPRTLARHSFDPRYPGIIGEFATSSVTDQWPELRSTSQRVLNRLRLADGLGYPLALPWSYRARDHASGWGLPVEHDIECFTLGTHCTP
jgi:hypothetical protein